MASLFSDSLNFRAWTNSPVQNLKKIQASRMYEARGEELKSDTGIILWLCLVGIKCGNYSDHGHFFTVCFTVSSARLNGRIAQNKKSRSNICTKKFALFQDYLHTVAKISTKAGQSMSKLFKRLKCQKLNLNQNLQNVKIWKDLQPVQSRVSSVVVMAAGVGVILTLVETSAQVQLYQRHYSA